MKLCSAQYAVNHPIMVMMINILIVVMMIIILIVISRRLFHDDNLDLHIEGQDNGV